MCVRCLTRVVRRVLNDDWLRLLGSLEAIGVELVSVNKTTGVVVVRVPDLGAGER